MKKIPLIAGIALLAAGSAVASPLQPKNCTLGEIGPDIETPFLAPIEEVGMYFNMPIEVKPYSIATIYCGEETVCESKEVAFNYNYGATEGSITISFEQTLLPKGKSYRLVLPAGAVHSLDYPDIESEEVTVRFRVPATIEEYEECNWPDGKRITCLDSFSMYWRYETKSAVEKPTCTLYRGDELIGSYPGDVTWDWNLGQVHFDFGEDIYFDKDVDYSIVVPAGIACSLYRDDILNEERVFRFKGDYIPEEPGLKYDSLRFRWHEQTHDLIGIDYIFSEPIILGDDPLVYIRKIGEETPVYNIRPYINDMVNCFVLSVDFDEVVWESETGYEIILTEGSVHNIDGLPNKTISAGAYPSGISEIRDENETAPLYDLSGNRVTNPTKGKIYILSGRKIMF